MGAIQMLVVFPQRDSGRARVRFEPRRSTGPGTTMIKTQRAGDTCMLPRARLELPKREAVTKQRRFARKSHAERRKNNPNQHTTGMERDRHPLF